MQKHFWLIELNIPFSGVGRLCRGESSKRQKAGKKNKLLNDNFQLLKPFIWLEKMLSELLVFKKKWSCLSSRGFYGFI